MKRNKVVYFHRRKDTGEVFYVGYGSIKRPTAKDGRSEFWWNIVNKIGYDVEIVHTDLTWEEACKLEIKYIKEFGRRDLGLGNLVNMTDGGDGLTNITKKTRTKLSKALTGISNAAGYTHTEEARKVMSDFRKGVEPWNKDKSWDEETRQRISIGVSGENHGSSILTEKDVLEIRRRYAEGGVLQRELAEEFGVKAGTIGGIINRRRWKHI